MSCKKATYISRFITRLVGTSAVCILFMCNVVQAQAAVVPYEGSHIDSPSSLYEVKVDNIPIDVIHLRMNRPDNGAIHGDTH
jgi:hypothetical protein